MSLSSPLDSHQLGLCVQGMLASDASKLAAQPNTIPDGTLSTLMKPQVNL